MRTATVEPLVDGETLTREAFERRYQAMPDARAELIEGIVHMASPTKNPHAAAHTVLATWASRYAEQTNDTYVLTNISYRLDERNELQPDVVVVRAPKHGGRARVDADGFLVGAPELVIEVAVASRERDLEQKLRLYERAGVQEYLVWEAELQRVHWWTLQEDRYLPLTPNAEGVWCSQIFLGLCLDAVTLNRLRITARWSETS